MVPNASVFYILTCKCAWRHSGVPFFGNFSTSALQKSGPDPWCFSHFDLQMCFAPQRRANFPHPNFQKVLRAEVLCTFWLANVLLGTCGLPKVLRQWTFLSILTCKCALRHSGVPFFLSALSSYLRTRRFSEPTFWPSRHTNHWKKHSISWLP